MLRINSQIGIDESELSFRFIRASGPGGQHVNKASTAVQLRFDAMSSAALPPEVRARLRRLAGRRLGRDGVLTIDARRFRSQDRNREDAMERLVRLLRRAAEAPRARRKTHPPARSREARLAVKRRRSERKRQRGAVAPEE